MFSFKWYHSLMVLYLILIISALYIVSNVTLAKSIELHDLIVLLFATVVTAMYPLKYGGVSRLNIFWLAIFVLHVYGIGSVLFIYQLAILLFLLFSRSKEVKLAKFPIYSIVFFVGPLLSYIILVLLNVNFFNPTFRQMLLANVSFYLIFLVFRGIAFTILKSMQHQKMKATKSYFISEMTVTLFFILLGSILYPLVESYGAVSILIALIFYLLAAFQTRKYDSSLRKSRTLENVMEMQSYLNESNTKQELTIAFLQKVATVTEAEHVYLIKKTATHFVLEDVDLQKYFVKCSEQQFLYEIFLNRKLKYIKKHTSWNCEEWPSNPLNLESVLFLPLKVSSNEEAVLMLDSSRRDAFSKGKIEFCRLLSATYLTDMQHLLAMEATIYKSERCALTDLYNYRYLTECIAGYERQFEQQELDCVSTIILDIDHFKRLNDTYGHENGNIILKKIANLLRHMVDDDYVLARYGGEEFVILLPNTTSTEALKLAEQLRQTIGDFAFTVNVLHHNEQRETSVNVTVSVGVANIPEHTSNISELITFADKALYAGAKQAGRNRVAVFREQLAN